jgi:precorrin-3B synthase
LLLIGIAEQNIAALAGDAERLGFVTRANDPRRRIIACPGAPACASGFIAARAIAGEIAESAALRNSETIHISGCAKGCAHPRPAALTIVGSEHGCGIVEHGTTRATPHAFIDPRLIAAYLAQRVSEAAHG